MEGLRSGRPIEAIPVPRASGHAGPYQRDAELNIEEVIGAVLEAAVARYGMSQDLKTTLEKQMYTLTLDEKAPVLREILQTLPLFSEQCAEEEQDFCVFASCNCARTCHWSG